MPRLPVREMPTELVHVLRTLRSLEELAETQPPSSRTSAGPRCAAGAAAGLLPNTQWVTARYPLFLRADLLRVLRAPRDRYQRGVDHQAARTLIERAAV